MRNPTPLDIITGRTGIGGNHPPELIDDEFDAVKKRVDDVYGEAKLWLDGEAIASQAVADDVGKLINMLRAAHKAADTARKAEKAPLDAKVAAVQEKYNPLLKKASSAIDACKAVLQTFLQQEERKKREAEEIARREAEARQEALREAQRRLDKSNLDDRERLEEAIDQAKHADVAAKKAAKAKVQVKGGGRAVSLRTRWVPHLKDARAAARHYWTLDPELFNDVLQKLAEQDVAKGAREIPGFEIVEEKDVV